MADETAKPERAVERAAARGTQSSPANAPEEARFSAEDLVENPRLLGPGITTPMVAGALYGADRKTFTLAEMAERVNDFLGRELP